MSLSRVLEPEVMDSEPEAVAYDSMDHSVVNGAFVQDLLAAGFAGGDCLDLGTGTAQIPIELCRQSAEGRILALDAAVAMLDLARLNLELAGCTDRVELRHLDAKQLPFPDRSFGTVMSNSIVHHIPEPRAVLAEAVRVAAPEGLLFFRDLLRPDSKEQVQQLVEQYAGEADERQRALFEASLHAALDLAEIRQLVEELGFPPESVQATSDRHWTWSARKGPE